jgi:DUF4097 and DUF4098 domain-containing protein YvlB
MKRKWLIAGVLIVIEVALLVSIIVIGWTGVDDIESDGFGIRIFHADLMSARADEEWQFVADGNIQLVVDSAGGDIQIVAGDTDEIVIQAHKTAWHSTTAKAEAALEGMLASASQNGDKITVRYQREPKFVILGAVRSDTVDFVISVPENTVVIATTSTGEVVLEDTIGDAELHCDFGDIAVSGVKGGLDVDSDSGDITVRNIEAGSASIDLRSDFGEITLEDAQGNDVEAHSNSGRITFQRIDAAGYMILTSDFGKLVFEKGSAASLVIEANSGSITLTDLVIEGALEAHSDFGAINLQDVIASQYLLDANSGAVRAFNVAGDVNAHSDFGDIEIVATEAVNLELDTNSGSIDFSGTLGAGPHTLQTDFGSIQLNVPEETALSFDFETDFGKIQSDFPVTVIGSVDENHWQGSINDGGAELSAKTNSGDISIKFLTP